MKKKIKISSTVYTPILLFTIILMLGFMNRIVDSIRGFKGRKYTIAMIYNIKDGHTGGKIFYYTYKVKGKEYQNNFSGIASDNKVYGVLYISFLESDIRNSMIIEKKVPDCLQYSDAPFNGWSKLPNENICDSLGLVR